MIDLYTIQLATTTVTMVAGVMFILDTFLRKTDAAGRVWAVSFMAGVLSAVAYAAWVVMPAGWWAVAVGNAAIVLSGALLWSGARAYNGRTHLVWLGAGGATVAGVSVLLAGPEGGDWAGALVLFALIATFAGLGAAESLRTPMRGNWTARGLTVMFVVVGLLSASRAVVFLVAGPDHPVFSTLLGTEAAAFALIALIIVTLASLLILQSERRPDGPGRQQRARAFDAESVLHESAFRDLVDDRLERTNFHGEQLVLMRIELDELDALNTAFGRSIGAQLLGEFAGVVRRHSSPSADIGAVAPGVLVVAAPYASLEGARSDAEAVQAALRDHRIDATQGLRLSASVGIVGTDQLGYDFDGLMLAAADAAARARASGGDAIVAA